MGLIWYFFLLLAVKKKKRDEKKAGKQPYSRCHSRYQKAFHRGLSAEERQLCQRRIPCESLHLPRASAWRRLFYSYNNQALITVTGLDHASFEYLLCLFEPVFNATTPFGEIVEKSNKRGRKRTVTAVDCLGLVLTWTRTRGSTMSLQMCFGLSMMNMSMYLRFGCRIVADVLSNDYFARIAIPSDEQIQKYKDAVTEIILSC
jgi:hypothetical protein